MFVRSLHTMHALLAVLLQEKGKKKGKDYFFQFNLNVLISFFRYRKNTCLFNFFFSYSSALHPILFFNFLQCLSLIPIILIHLFYFIFLSRQFFITKITTSNLENQNWGSHLGCPIFKYHMISFCYFEKIFNKNT